MATISWNDLRMHKQLCDGTLRTLDGTLFPIHRVILSTFSPYFRALFTNVLNNGQPELTEILIPDVSSDIIRAMIEFAYTQNCLLTHKNVFPLMIAADKLMSNSLVKFCSDYILPAICADNCVSIYRVSKHYFFKALEVSAWQNMCTLVEHVVDTPDFLSLTVDELKKLLKDDDLNVKCEEIVFEVISSWVYANPEKRRHAIAQLLSCIRFGYVSPDYYRFVIKRFPYLTKESEEFLETVDHLFDKSEDSYYYRYCYFNPRSPDEVILAFGGWSEGMPCDTVEIYDYKSDCWYLTPLKDPKIRAYHGVVELNNLIYVIGGFDGREYYSNMYCLDPVTGIWTEKACMHEDRCYFAVCKLDNDIYAMGGYSARKIWNTAEKYNPSLNQWTMIAPMNGVRSDASAAVFQNKIFIAGGSNGTDLLQTVERYCPKIDQWDYIDSMSSPRYGIGLITFGHCIYALGGFDGSRRIKTVERYNAKYSSWEIVADMHCGRSHMATVIMDNSIYAIGGFNGDESIGHGIARSTEMYDIKRNIWFDISPMNFNRGALAACVCRRLPNAEDYTYAGIVW